MGTVHHAEEPHTMRDETIERLDALSPPSDVSSARQWLADNGAAIAQAAHDDHEDHDCARSEVAILDSRALLLLFDVLVGITIGTLRHHQGYWHTEVVTAPPAQATRLPLSRRYTRHSWTCGTYRCVAGWVVHTGNALAEPTVAEVFSDHLGRVYHRAYAVRIPGADRSVNYFSAAMKTLKIDPIDCGASIDDLFSATSTLADIWNAADRATGGAIRPPASLVERINAASVTA